MFLNCENDKKRSFISGFLQILVVAILVSSILSGCDKEDLPWYQKKVIEDLTPQGQPNVSFDHCTLTDANIDTLVFGLHVHGEHQTSQPTLDAIDDIGLKWVLNGFHWPTIEGEKDAYRIAENYDHFFLAMAQRDVQVLMSVGNYWPTWLEDSEELKDELYELTKLLVKRYRPGGDFAQENGLGNYGVRYWEMINEPNYPCCGWGPHGGQQPVNSALYAELMSEMHRAIREEAPDVFILLGGLSSTDLYQDPIEFLDDIYSYGGKDAFDILAYHPYDQYQNLAATQAGLRLKMAEYGDGNKPIWITELGDPDLSTGPNGELSQVDLFDVSAAQFSDMEAFFWLGMHDFTGQNETWGILQNNQSPRQPIYNHVKAFVDSIYP
ncbi:MAG: hypothetical protein H6603_05540 [Flavobacteriales bacterium]|nr:hypothetical protein [Flavobacteriales bacterium]MCB9204422.1 hypothetical protein [Flavobacteriales bacterium]